MGRPVVVSDHGGHRETVIDSETGWRVGPTTCRLAAARAALSSMNATRHNGGRRHRQRARPFLQLRHVRPHLVVYRELLTDRTRDGAKYSGHQAWRAR